MENQTKDIQIIAEEKDYLVLNKPAGIMVHPDGRSKEETVCDFLLSKYPELKEVGEPVTQKNGEIIERPGIVHRLDKDTSGILLVARTEKGFKYLKNQFKNRKVQKTYHAFIYGNIKEDEFTINEPIGRSKKDFRRWFAGEKARGTLRPAETLFKVIKRSENKTSCLIEASPKTGRTHQIRVHLKHIYKPIVNDSLYAPKRDSILGFERQALHAYKIKFHNLENKIVEYQAEYPEDFKKALASFV